MSKQSKDFIRGVLEKDFTKADEMFDELVRKSCNKLLDQKREEAQSNFFKEQEND